MPFAGHRAEVLAFLLIAGFVLATSVRVPPRLVGDGAEYFVVAEALARHASPDLRLGDRESVRQMLDAEGVAGGDRLQEVPEVIGRDGRAYGIHFWGYPLLTLPVRFALRRMGTSGLRAPQVTNALLFVAAVGLALFRSPFPDHARRTFATLTVLSPALWFVLWPHPEVFSFSLAIAALVWRSTGRRSLAVLAAALASVQNPPLVLLALALSAEAIRDAFTKPERKASGLAAPAVCLLPALVPSLFCLWQFGTPSLLTRGAVSSANMSSGRTLELLFDLNVGLLPYAPVVVVGSLCAALRARSRIAAWALALAMGYLCTATCNWNSGTSGPARYAVWIYPLILYVFVSAIRGGTDRDSTTSRGLALLAIVSQGLLVGSRGGMEPRADYLRHSAAARFLLDRWPSAYNPTYEIFVERTRQQEEPFPGPAPILYRFRGECRKALAQKRHLAVLRALCGHDPSNVGELRRRVAREGRALWMYLNYD
jgi:hypothetical protein